MINAVQTALHEPSVRNAVLYIGGATVGICVNWGIKWMRGDIDCIFDMLVTKPGHTVASFLTQIVAVSAFVGTGALDNSSVAASVALGLGAGTAIDVWINRGQIRQWTNLERKHRERAEITLIKNKLLRKKK